ncbi:MAG: hypothetical protein M5U28_18875 [Sandaracinaceae bacterium]|nr:hypothetical protein [Sandaracinaceae bacterium]
MTAGRPTRAPLLVLCAILAMPGAAGAQSARRVELHFTPTARAQIAIWIESEDGARFATVRLTEAVAYRGIGNRTGALQMNSGYRWPLRAPRGDAARVGAPQESRRAGGRSRASSSTGASRRATRRPRGRRASRATRATTTSA